MSARTSAPGWLVAGVLLNRDARWMTPHLWRFGFLAALFIVFWSASQGLSRVAAPGLFLLQSLAGVSAVGLIAMAVVGAGSVFRDEWLGNNMELLQLTGVSGFDLLLARLIPIWLTAASLLLLEIPCFLLCVTLGGVTPLQVFAVSWQLIWLFLVASGFTVLSAAALRKPGTIIFVTVVLLLGYHLLTLGIDFGTNAGRAPAFLGRRMRVIAAIPDAPCVNWFVELSRILSSGFSGPAIGWPTLVHAAAVAGCLYCAAWILRRRLLLPREELSLEETAPEGQAHQTNIPVWRPSYQVPRCRGNAVEWKDFHFTLGGSEMMDGKWLLLAVAVPVLLAMTWGLLTMVYSARAWRPWILLCCVVLIIMPIGSLAFMAQRVWVQEIRERTLTGLVLLPWSAREIIVAKLRNLVRMVLPEMILSALALGVFTLGGFVEESLFSISLLILGLYLSIPMVVCSDAAWRFLPQTWAGFVPRTTLAGMNLAAWFLSGCLAGLVSPILGLVLLAVLVPWSCHISINIAAHWLSSHAGELGE